MHFHYLTVDWEVLKACTSRMMSPKRDIPIRTAVKVRNWLMECLLGDRLAEDRNACINVGLNEGYATCGAKKVLN